MLLLRFVLVLVIALFMPSAAIASTNGWQEYKSPAGDAAVLMPTPVKNTSDKDDKDGIENFESSAEDSGYIYTLMLIPNASEATFEDELKEFKDGMAKKDGCDFSNQSDIKGTGWSGKKFDAKFKDARLSVLCAVDENNKQFISLATTGELGDPDTNAFFQSLKIDPELTEKKIKAWEDSKPSIFKPRNSTETAGLVVFCIGLGIAIFAYLGFLIQGFRTGLMWGVGMIFFPQLVGFIFLIRHFGRAALPALCTVVSIGLMVTGVMLGAK